MPRRATPRLQCPQARKRRLRFEKLAGRPEAQNKNDGAWTECAADRTGGDQRRERRAA
jgi:hypothetical protein